MPKGTGNQWRGEKRRDTVEGKKSAAKGADPDVSKETEDSAEGTGKLDERSERLLKAVEAIERSIKREKPVKKPKKKEVKVIKPAPKREWPKGSLTWQQAVWLYGGLFLRALGPLFLYALMPSLCLVLGYVFGGHQEDEMSLEEFFTYGANFYTTIGTFLTLWILHIRAKRRGSTIWEESTLFAKEM